METWNSWGKACSGGKWRPRRVRGDRRGGFEGWPNVICSPRVSYVRRRARIAVKEGRPWLQSGILPEPRSPPPGFNPQDCMIKWPSWGWRTRNHPQEHHSVWELSDPTHVCRLVLTIDVSGLLPWRVNSLVGEELTGWMTWNTSNGWKNGEKDVLPPWPEDSERQPKTYLHPYMDLRGGVEWEQAKKRKSRVSHKREYQRPWERSWSHHRWKDSSGAGEPGRELRRHLKELGWVQERRQMAQTLMLGKPNCRNTE